MSKRTTPPFRVTVNVPTGYFTVKNDGVTFHQTVPGDWYLPLSRAKDVFDAALRSVEVMLEFGSSPADVGVEDEGGRTGATRGRVAADEGEIPPAERLPSDCSGCPYWFPVCCKGDP